MPPGGWHVIKFPDDTEVRLAGLDGIMFDFYLEGREANNETVAEIIKMLEDRKNYIPSSDHVRREYSYAILKEYRKYVKDRADNNK